MFWIFPQSKMIGKQELYFGQMRFCISDDFWKEILYHIRLKLVAQCKAVVTPVLLHCRHCGLSLSCPWYVIMMTSWHGNTFHITDPLWGNPQVTDVDSPYKELLMQSFYFLEHFIEQTVDLPVIWDTMTVMVTPYGNRPVSQIRAPPGGLSRTSGTLWQDYSNCYMFWT